MVEILILVSFIIGAETWPEQAAIPAFAAPAAHQGQWGMGRSYL
jgi:hypothetical protein